MNLGDMRTLVCSQLGNIRLTDAEAVDGVDACINAANTIMTADVETPFRLAYGEVTIDTSGVAALPADCRLVNAVYSKHTGRQLRWTRGDAYSLDHGSPDSDRAKPGMPECCEQLGDRLAVFPHPGAPHVFMIEYLQILPTLQLATDVPIAAVECHYGIALGAVELYASHPPYDPRTVATAKEWRLKTEMQMAHLMRGRTQKLRQVQEIYSQRAPMRGHASGRYNTG
jgi:hypothetical protein